MGPVHDPDSIWLRRGGRCTRAQMKGQSTRKFSQRHFIVYLPQGNGFPLHEVQNMSAISYIRLVSNFRLSTCLPVSMSLSVINYRNSICSCCFGGDPSDQGQMCAPADVSTGSSDITNTLPLRSRRTSSNGPAFLRESIARKSKSSLVATSSGAFRNI